MMQNIESIIIIYNILRRKKNHIKKEGCNHINSINYLYDVVFKFFYYFFCNKYC